MIIMVLYAATITGSISPVVDVVCPVHEGVAQPPLVPSPKDE